MNLFILLGYIGPWQIVIIVLAIVLLFGGRKIPELMKGLGQGIKEFKKATGKEDQDKEQNENSDAKDSKQKIE